MEFKAQDSFPLGLPWRTFDPFLFCVHHVDHYPRGTASLGPDAALTGRLLGQDFELKDGWRMYHGTRVPGFPKHPHRGFEAITLVRRGLVDHSDSLGASARFGQGDVQWLTTGRGIVHAEMFPLLERSGPNTLELFQIWLNLPAAEKDAAPRFSMTWANELPTAGSAGVSVSVICGELLGKRAPPPPPHSWAAREEAEAAIYRVALAHGARFTLPSPRRSKTVRTIYLFDGPALLVDGHRLEGQHGLKLPENAPVQLLAEFASVELLVLQAKPIGEPVVQHGPFVMSSAAEVQRAFVDYQRTGFGGWSWRDEDPTHGPLPERFAQYPDGRIDRPKSQKL